MIKSVIVDIDGTVAECEERVKAYLEGEKDWERFYSAAENDEPVREVISVVQAIADKGHPLIFITGRPERYREPTLRWLEKQGLKPKLLLMRSDGDHRPDVEVKKDHYDHLLRMGVEVLCVFEDRSRVVQMWRDQGLVCFQVREGQY